NLVVLEVNRAEGLLSAFRITPVFELQLFLEYLLELAVGIFAGIFFIAFVVVIVIVGPSRTSAAPRILVIKRAIVRNAFLMQHQEREVTFIIQRLSGANQNFSASAVGAFQLLGIKARFGVLVRERNRQLVQWLRPREQLLEQLDRLRNCFGMMRRCRLFFAGA